MYPLLIGVFTLGLVCEPLFARLFTILQSTYRDYRFRRQMFAQDAFVKSLEANGWLLIPPDAQATNPYNVTAESTEDHSLDDWLNASNPDWFEAGKGTQ